MHQHQHGRCGSGWFRARARGAFTLLEILTVLLAISLLVVLLFPALHLIRQRMEKAKCMANLRGLSLATNIYVQDNGQWPQIGTSSMQSNYAAYSSTWIEALKPYGISQMNWICPTTQRLLGDPDLKKPENARIDYVPMPFDDKRMTPFRWPKHPWFIERSSVHGNGNLIIFTNGTIEEALDLIPKS